MTTRLLSVCLALLLASTTAWPADEPTMVPEAGVPAETPKPAPASIPKIPTPAITPSVTPVTQPAPKLPVPTAPSVVPLPVPAGVNTLPAPLTPVPAQNFTPKSPAAQAEPDKTAVPEKPPAKPGPAPLSPSTQQLLPKPAAEKILKSTPAPPTLIQDKTTPNQTADESASENSAKMVDIEVFVREGCEQCDKAKEFLSKLQSLQPHLKIIIRDVRKEPAAQELLKRMAQAQGQTVQDYPAFVTGGQLIVGFSEEGSTAQLILDILAKNKSNGLQVNLDADNCKTGRELSCVLVSPPSISPPKNTTLHFLGYSIPLTNIALPVLTVIMGLLDGFSHGSTWVLILMISLLAPMKNRSMMLTIAGTFIAVQGVIYFALLTVWLNLFIVVGTSHMTELAIASIAIIAAVVYLKQYLYFGQSVALSSHEISKPGIYTRIRKILQSENASTALLGTALLATLVQLSEFSYKSIFPAMYTRVLTLQNLDALSNYGYLFLYDLAYMLDDMVILAIGVITLKQPEEKQKQEPYLLLASGTVMAAVAAYLAYGVR